MLGVAAHHIERIVYCSGTTAHTACAHRGEVFPAAVLQMKPLDRAEQRAAVESSDDYKREIERNYAAALPCVAHGRQLLPLAALRVETFDAVEHLRAE